jgi:hypothetical protein
MSFKFSFYALNIYLMKTLFTNVIFLFMLDMKEGQYISACSMGKLPNHLQCESSLPLLIFGGEAVSNQHSEIFFTFFWQALFFCRPTSLTPKNNLFPPLPALDDSCLIDLPQHLNAPLNASNKFFH